VKNIFDKYDEKDCEKYTREAKTQKELIHVTERSLKNRVAF